MRWACVSLFVVVLALWRAPTGGASQPAGEALRVMTFNLWHGGEAGGYPLEHSVEVIRASGADVVGLQETHGLERDGRREDNGRRIADRLGWYYVDQGQRTGVLSRVPIVAEHPGGTGVVVRLTSRRDVHVLNVHLAHAPYQPYQLLRIPYEDAPFLTTSDEAVAAARRARSARIDEVMAVVRPLLARDAAVVVTGDFNEPSSLDWTPRAAAAGLVPLAVSYPSVRALADTGLRDAFRTIFPDEVRHPGHTWTPTTRSFDPRDRHDRIDFVLAGGTGVDITSCQVVGEAAPDAHIIVNPWPSDHRAVVASIRIGGAP